jgi:putative aminopeptidase FrvX
MYDLLRALCGIASPSGCEAAMKNFLLDYISRHQHRWRVQPEVIHGPAFQDCLILRFGKPRLAAFAHMDTTGFTVRYHNQLVAIGGPEVAHGDRVVGADALGLVECTVEMNDEHELFYRFARGIQRGTTLTYKPNFRQDADTILSPYLDNRAGIFNLLKLAETLEDGLLIFSAWEEHGGGSVPYLVRYMVEKWGVQQALISDLTWVTEGVAHGGGVAISLRDRNIPRRAFIDKVLALAGQSGVPCQLEVEASGSSDGREIQQSPYAVDWCFVGAPEDHAHTAHELVYKDDLEAMMALYQYLFAHMSM